MTPPWSIRRLTAVDDAAIEGLADVLIACVDGLNGPPPFPWS